MATLSFKDFSQGKPVQVVGNESQAQQMEQESGQPSLMSKLGQRAKDFGKEALTLGTLGASTVDPNTPQADKTLATVEGLTKAGVAPVKMLGAVGGAVGDVVGAGLQATGLDKPLGEALAPIAESDVAQKAVQAFKSLPQEYQDYLSAGLDASNLIGLGVGKKAVTTGLEAGAKAVGKVGVPEAVGNVANKVLPTSEGIMQRVARIPKGEQAKFEKLTGKSVGTFLDETGNYGTPDKIVERLYTDFTKSKQTADDALDTIQGTYRATPVRTALNELDGKVERTSSPGANDPDLIRVKELITKEKTQGLTMTEINEVKRIYERRVRLDYLKSNVAEDVTRANNVDNALRTWQFAEAEKAGLKNLPEINKFTQANKQLMDALGKEQAGIGGNNALGLTDAILLAGGSPESIASLLVKKTFSDKGLQSFVAKKLSKNKEKTGVPEAQFKDKLQLPTPKTGTPNVSIEIPINLLSKSQSAIEKELVAKFGKKYTKAQIYEMANRLKELPAPKGGQTKVQIEVPINVKPTKDIDISRGFKTSKQDTPQSLEKVLLPSTKSTPTPTKSKGIRGMVNPDELVPKKAVSTLEQEAKKYKSAEEFVKAQGAPVYHGTNAKFDTFDKSKVNSVESFGDYSGTGFYFTTDKTKAGRYATQAVKKNGGSENIMETYLTMKNPLVIKSSVDSQALRDSFGGDEAYFTLKPQEIQKELIKRGYDSVDDRLYGQKIVFSPSQIKTKAQIESIWDKSVK